MLRPVDCPKCGGSGCDVCDGRGFVTESFIAEITHAPQPPPYTPKVLPLTVRTCDICEDKFKGKGRAKYCSQNCRKIGQLYYDYRNRCQNGFGMGPCTHRIYTAIQLLEVGYKEGLLKFSAKNPQRRLYCSGDCRLQAASASNDFNDFLDDIFGPLD